MAAEAGQGRGEGRSSPCPGTSLPLTCPSASPQVARQEGRIILTSGLPYHKVGALKMAHLSKGASAWPLGHRPRGLLAAGG